MLAELEDRVEQIFASIESLRESIDNGKARRELLDALFRNVHSLKAVAGATDFENVSELAHEFENLLHALRVGRLQLDDNVLSLFDEVADGLFTGLHTSLADDRPKPLLARLNNLAAVPTAQRRDEVEIVLSSLPGELWQSLSEGERHRLKESVREGASLFLISTSFDVAEFDRLFQKLKARLNDKGEVISTAPKVGDEIPPQIDFRILYTQDALFDQVQAQLAAFNDVSVSEIIGGSAEPTFVVEKSEAETEIAEQTTERNESTAKHIRVSLEDLDRLISSTHKLIRQAANSLEYAENASSPRIPKLELRLRDLKESFLSLAGEIVDLRMVTIDRLLRRAVRSGRAVARAAGKEIDFVIRGETLLLDKALSEAIADPLIHLIRNAVDHGIETVAERSQLGKGAHGTVWIEARNIQGQTRITVSDDGRGIDSELVSRAAKRAGLVPADAEVSMEKCLRLIFRPGFSTVGKVSVTSGRGVGLDAVENAIEEVGGAVRVATMKGKGASFEIQLPVTFGLLDVTAATVGDYKYLIDRAHVLSSHTLDLEDIEERAGEWRIHLANESLPLVSLEDLLGYGELDPNELNGRAVFICAPNKGSSDKVALTLDVVEENQKVLVRNLGSRGARWFGVAAASELSDGRVALLLDLPQLLMQEAFSRQ